VSPPRRSLDVAATACGWVAGFFVAAMMLVTVSDVALRWTVAKPIRGVIEIVELLLACAFFFAVPATFLRDEHVVVDVIDGWWPRATRWLKRVANVLAVVVLVAMGWQGWLVARDMLEFGDVTSDLSIPKIYYWMPVLVGIGAGAVAAAVMIFRRDDLPRDGTQSS
jgi:TRAP-type C4-dicarboxylate transport system permease small subunit